MFILDVYDSDEGCFQQLLVFFVVMVCLYYACRGNITPTSLLQLSVTYSLLFREDNPVIPAQVHESEEAEQPVIVSIEVTILIRFMLCVPQLIYKLTAFLVGTHQ